MGRLSRHDRVAAGILQWGLGSLRDLPWRRTSDPWLILVSEVMLQQTSVGRVLPKYAPFVERFPTPASLAEAPLGEALVLWQGLGYPRRCRNLREAAIVVCDRHGGAMPDSLDQLLALPGVGRYTARAVLAFAWRRDVAVVDTNVSRVLSRLEGRSMTAGQLQLTADALVPQGMGWEWNQTMMEFGARWCTVREPSCTGCPVRRQCRWKGTGDDPAPASAGASRPQGRFEGSDRQVRGRIMRALARGPRSTVALVDELATGHAGRIDGERITRLVAVLVAEGLAVEVDGLISLP